jgi:Major Facilitator Superfamily
MIALALAFPINRWLSGRFGDYRVFVAAFVVYALASYLCAISQTLWLFLPSRIFLGLAGGITLPIGQALMLQEYPPRLRSVGLGTVHRDAVHCSLSPGWLDRRRARKTATFEVGTVSWSVHQLLSPGSLQLLRMGWIREMCGMREPHKRGQSDKYETGQQKCIIQCEEGRLLGDESSKSACDHARAEAGVFQLVGELLKQIEGSKPPSSKKIRQVELVKRRTPVQNHTLQGDTEGAGRDPQNRRLFRSTHNLPAGQTMQGDNGQGREEAAHPEAQEQHGPKNLIVGSGDVEQADPEKGEREAQQINAGEQASVYADA